MSQRLIRQYRIAISPTHSFPPNETTFFQVDDNSLNGPLRDSHLSCHFSQNDIRIAVQNEQDVGVVGKERPTSS